MSRQRTVSAACSVALLLFSTLPSLAKERPTPQGVKKLLALKGCRETVSFLFGEDEKDWDVVLDGVASGQRAWLSVAQQLSPCTDAHSSETLGMAVGEALPKAPSLTLQMFGTEACRGVGFADQEAKSLAQVLGEIAKRKQALKTVTMPALAAARQECLRLLQETEKSAPTWNWAKE